MIQNLSENPQAGALSWLMEMELVGNPAVLNTLIANIVASTRGVQDVQFVLDGVNKKILVYIELKKYYGWYYKKEVLETVSDMLEQVLPSYQKRIIFDKTILNKALAIVEASNAKKQNNSKVSPNRDKDGRREVPAVGPSPKSVDELGTGK